MAGILRSISPINWGPVWDKIKTTGTDLYGRASQALQGFMKGSAVLPSMGDVLNSAIGNSLANQLDDSGDDERPWETAPTRTQLKRLIDRIQIDATDADARAHKATLRE